ncbi:Complement C1q subcomponent subunit A [Nibea albiflora]|nr:Complement C1q subcomponent subunit A [Nibea albiflora]
MGGFYGLVILAGVAFLLRTGRCEVNCGGGRPAQLPRGPVDPNVLLRLKGEMGNRGEQGVMGPKGYRGDLGAAGDRSPQQARSAFSVMRTDNSYPTFDQVVTYQHTVVNTPQDFNAATGYFTCRIPGVYYFTFHSMARVSVCLRLASDPPFTKLGFCDYNKNFDQVLSGGAVLELTAGQRVWLESFREQQRSEETRDTNEKQIIFNGFLLFANPA